MSLTLKIYLLKRNITNKLYNFFTIYLCNLNSTKCTYIELMQIDYM